MTSVIEYVQVVGTILHDYIAIHDDVFLVRWSRVQLFGPGFEAIEFQAHIGTLKELEELLEKIREEVEKEAGLAPTGLTGVLLQYCQSLGETMRSFREMCAALDTRRSLSNTYSWSKYQRDLSEYQAKVREYQIVGDALNREMAKLQ